jgi:hypothetical protein
MLMWSRTKGSRDQPLRIARGIRAVQPLRIKARYQMLGQMLKIRIKER